MSFISLISFNIGVMESMINLRSLDLSFNNLNEFYLDAQPSNMTEIFLSHNKLAMVPWKNLSSIPNLRFIDIGFNNLSNIEDSYNISVRKGIQVILIGKDYDFLHI